MNDLTKRELFAAMAMQGLCACPNDTNGPEALAVEAMQYADALLAELAKPTQQEIEGICDSLKAKQHAPEPCDHDWTGPDGETVTECSKCGSGLPF